MPAELAVRPLKEVAAGCREETDKYFRGAPASTDYCYELFRRALLDRDERAWDALYQQYKGLVHRWVVAHSAFPQDEPIEPCISGVFARFWRAISPDRFERFPSVAALLAFLKRCVHGYLMDTYRRPAQVIEVEPDERMPAPVEMPASDLPVLWALLLSRCHGEAEQIVAYTTFALDMEPREIWAAYPEQFADVADVHRIKRNVVARWRRDPEIRAYDAQGAMG